MATYIYIEVATGGCFIVLATLLFFGYNDDHHPTGNPVTESWFGDHRVGSIWPLREILDTGM
jgi:hypothetical protein